MALARLWRRNGLAGATFKLSAHVRVENFPIVRRQRTRLVVFAIVDARQRAYKKRLRARIAGDRRNRLTF